MNDFYQRALVSVELCGSQKVNLFTYFQHESRGHNHSHPTLYNLEHYHLSAYPEHRILEDASRTFEVGSAGNTRRHFGEFTFSHYNFYIQIIGGICVFCVGWNILNYQSYLSNTTLFFLCMAVSFFIGTFCLLLSCLVSLSTGGIISKTIYELIYHSIACILYLIAAILLLSRTLDYRRESTHPHMIASVLGLVLAGLYLISAVLAQRSYRGI